MPLDPKLATVWIEPRSSLGALEKLRASTAIASGGVLQRHWLDVSESSQGFFWQMPPGRWPLFLSAANHRERALWVEFERGVNKTIPVLLEPERTPIFRSLMKLSEPLQRIFIRSGTDSYESLTPIQRAAALNILAKMGAVRLDGLTVRDYVKRVSEFRRNRIYCRLAQDIRPLLGHLRRVTGILHPGSRDGSYKTLESKGGANLQLSFSVSESTVDCDADIDLYSDAFRHFFGEVMVNRLADLETDPFRVYEALMGQGVRPEYELDMSDAQKWAVLVHGWADPSGKYTTDRLRPYLEADGFRIYEADYGFSLLPSLFHNHQVAERLAATTPEGAVGFGHSNGCWILKLACDYGAPFDRLVFLNPALDPKVEIARQVRRIDVWHAPNDVPVSIAALLPFHPWGEMGRVGYHGTDPRFINHEHHEGHLGLFRKLPLYANSLLAA